jgi:orotidine-5'-phosphate decarboxylase
MSNPKEVRVIVAADVLTLKRLRRLATNVKDVLGIVGFKIGFALAMQYGLRAVADVIKEILGEEFLIIYDHQKAGNDIPDMGKQFAEVLRSAGIKTAILFPFAGPETQEEWTKNLSGNGIKVIIGGIMTINRFLEKEGGYISDGAPRKIYDLACDLGVRDFVVPGNKPELVKTIRGWLIDKIGEGTFTLYAPGFITQGGDISECGNVAGYRWYAIVGSAIHKKKTDEEQRQAAIAVTRLII